MSGFFMFISFVYIHQFEYIRRCFDSTARL
ncbi:unnamed protein product [Spirodela intermedia]|uniref:Uncharacterized protein n=1 Tax=Spirodela intermedia TaxID=51605 RepID=A0A7I8J263_SPIIN|nr:unnamed protein product [Spirodela intermedia]CAA6663461.1 unnamed protein product [Spirodela intermedia]